MEYSGRLNNELKLVGCLLIMHPVLSTHLKAGTVASGGRRNRKFKVVLGCMSLRSGWTM